ncbi:MAG: hypothetical protein IKP95_02365 [Ruminococcus sp.]|nr:hypothetical protein [Ruminococcus sp.]
MKLTEIMKQIPLDELTGDVDMKERNNITVSSSTKNAAAVKRTGALVAAAACAIAALGGVAAYKHLSKPDKDSGVSATDIATKDVIETETHKENYEYYRMLYRDEINNGADFDTLMKKVDVLDTAEGCTFRLDGVDGEFRVIGTRCSGDILRVDIEGDIDESSHIDNEFCFDVRNVRLRELIGDDGTPDDLVRTGTLWNQVYSEDGKKTVFSIAFAVYNKISEITDDAEFQLDLELDYYKNSRAGDPTFYEISPLTFRIRKHGYDYTLNPDVKVKLSDEAAYPGAEITLEELSYSDQSLRAVLDSEWGGEKLDSVWLRSGADGMISYLDLTDSETTSLIAARIGDTLRPILFGEGFNYGPWDVMDDENGRIVVACDFADHPIDASKITGFRFGIMDIEVGNGTAQDDPQEIQPDPSGDAVYTANKGLYKDLFKFSDSDLELAGSYMNIVGASDQEAASDRSSDGEHSVEVIGTRRFGDILKVDVLVCGYAQDDSWFMDPFITLTAPDGSNYVGRVDIIRADTFNYDKIAIMTVEFTVPKDYSTYSNTVRIGFNNNESVDSWYEGRFGVALPARYACKRGEQTYKLDGKLTIAHTYNGKDATCQVDKITVGNGGVGIGVLVYPGSEALDGMFNISEIPPAFSGSEDTFCTVVFKNGTRIMLCYSTISAAETLENGATSFMLYENMTDQPINADDIEKLVFSDGTELTMASLTSPAGTSVQPGSKDADGYIVVDDSNRSNATFEAAAELPVKSEWFTQYKKEDTKASFEIASFSLNKGKLELVIDLLDDSCKYLDGEDGIDKDRQSAAFYLPYFKTADGGEFISIITKDGKVIPTETRILSEQHLKKNALTLTTILSDSVPEDNMAAIRIGTAEIPLK